MNTPVTILSPHFDDAVLSCWTVLSGPGDVHVVNVFGGQPAEGQSGWWDHESSIDDPTQAIPARIEEDRRALALAGRTATNLDFLDAQYRSQVEQAAEPLAEALADAVAPGAVVYAPAAVGPLPDHFRSPYPPGTPHPDHLAVRTAALALAARGHELRLYADFPHASIYGLPAWVLGVDAPAGRADELWARMLGSDGLASRKLEPVVRRLDDAAFARKLEAVRTYASQVPAIETIFERRIDDPQLLGYEVAWRVG